MMMMNLHENSKCASYQNLAGILVIGGDSGGSTSFEVEFWSASDPEQGSCILNRYPRTMSNDPSVNLVSGRLVACYKDTCEVYRDGSWEHLQDTTVTRYGFSSATREDSALLIGGWGEDSTELIPVNGSAAKPGPFTVRHGGFHCTIQLSDDLLVVTGGQYSKDFVTEYDLVGGTETILTAMEQPRWYHACGVYRNANNQQVSKNWEKLKTKTNTKTTQIVYQDKNKRVKRLCSFSNTVLR